MEDTQPKENSTVRLFRLMHEALKMAKTIHPEAIFLYGEVKSGKSTSFNWICNPEVLIGGGLSIAPKFKLNNQLGCSYADIQDEYQSVTLIPNKKQIGTQGISIIDFPGIRDKRTEIEVMMGSFIFNTFFRYSKQAKFIIVISFEGFKSSEGDKFYDPICAFVKMFASGAISEQQREAIFDSVAFLITSAPIPKNYQQTKSDCLDLLSNNLKKLQSLSKSNEKLSLIYHQLCVLITKIITSKRIQLFPVAQFGRSPEICTLIQRLDACGWKYANLPDIFKKIKFPYEQLYNLLQEDKKKSLSQSIEGKLKEYEQISNVFSQIVQTYLNQPLAIADLSFQKQYENLEQILLQNSNIPIILPTKEQEVFKLPQPSITMIKNILKLNSFTFEIVFDDDRKEKDKNYFQYLKDYFIQTMRIFGQIFTTNNIQESILDNLMNIYGETFEHFFFICQIEESLLSSVHQKLKEASTMMNILNLTDHDIKNRYFKAIAEQQSLECSQYQVDEMQQMIQFIKDQTFQDFDQILIHNVLSKCCKLQGEQMKQDKQYKRALQSFLGSFINAVKVRSCLEYEIKQGLREEEDLSALLQAIIAVESSLYKDIKGVMYELDSSEQLIFMESYFLYCVLYCEQKRDSKELGMVIDKILKKLKMSRNREEREKIIFYQNKKRELQNHGSFIGVEQQQEVEIKQPSEEEYISFINFLRRQVFKQDQKLSLEEINQQTKEYYKRNHEQQEIKNEFTIDLPVNPTNYEILAYSKYLIEKINKRKTIIMLGEKSGKSTVSYWLRGKQLVPFKTEKGISYTLPNNSKEANRINRDFSRHTEIPNIYNLSEDQLLVDYPHMYSKDLQKMMIIGNISKQIILHSSETKFILVIKERDVLDNQGMALIRTLLQYIRMFKQFREDLDLAYGLFLIITFGDPKQQVKVRQILKKLFKLLKSQQIQEIMKDQFKIQVQASQISALLLLVEPIFKKKQYEYFDLQNMNYKKKHNLTHSFSQQWRYTSNIHDVLSDHFFLPYVKLKREEQQVIKKTIIEKIQKLNDLGLSIKNCVKTAIEHDVDYYKSFIQNSAKGKIEALVGQKIMQKENSANLTKAKQQKYILYPCLKELKIYQKSSEKIIQTCLSLNYLFQNMDHFNGQSTFNGVEPYIKAQVDKSFAICLLEPTFRSFFQGCRLKVYQLLQELKIYENQQIYVNYHQQLHSDMIVIRQNFDFTNDIQRYWIIDFFLNNFKTEEFLTQKTPEITQKLLNYFDIIKDNYKLSADHVKKIIQILVEIKEKANNDIEALHLELSHANFMIILNQMKETTSQIILIDLQSQLARMLEKSIIYFVSINRQAAKEVCFDYDDNSTTIRFYEKQLELSEGEDKKAVVRQYLAYLLQKGQRRGDISALLQRHQRLFSKQEQSQMEERMSQSIEFSLIILKKQLNLDQIKWMFHVIEAKIPKIAKLEE